jgi:hypothetical protein
MWPYLFSAAIGAAVGMSELVTRYRDEPSKLAAVPSAWFYVFLNASASSGALALAKALGWQFGATDPAVVDLTQVLACGFGAMLVLRSAFFNIKLENKDVPIGLSAVIIALLTAADRGVDRIRAISRSRHAAEIMEGVSFESSRQALATYALAMLQNATPTEQQTLSREIDAVAQSTLTDRQKALNLGLILITFVGPAGLEEIVRVHAEEISTSAVGVRESNEMAQIDE